MSKKKVLVSVVFLMQSGKANEWMRFINVSYLFIYLEIK